MNDAELIVASRHDPAAFRELYHRWADRLLAYLYRRVFEAPRGTRYAEGCAIFIGAAPVFPDGRNEIVAEIWQRDAPRG